ncbi:ABC transporter ATP-binding protein [Jonesia quinghaiensis]|uniref:ABC transporter ATP-binding protein n=1 Tax=Jonesia quinghaiensis TaxID=262806 RepID=UPI00048DF9C6|nr:ABC transporter ATP-binding protein [Jonesia quinghaiensis]
MTTAHTVTTESVTPQGVTTQAVTPRVAPQPAPPAHTAPQPAPPAPQPAPPAHTAPQETENLPAVRCTDVTVQFPSGQHTGPVTLSIKPGESVLIMGPSGSGKSTVLQRIIGAIPHAIHAEAHGTVHVFGRDMANHDPADNADVTGVVSQDPWSGVCFTLVEDDIAFPLENAAVPPSQIGERVRAAADLAGVGHLTGRHTTQLSGGELQRVALAAAIVGNPKLLLLDEPTSMLDHQGIRDVTAALASVREQTGAAQVLIEHRLDEIAAHGGVAELPPRWVLLDARGAVVWDGPADSIDAETARMLVRRGCWLPLDVELLGVFGELGGLANPAIQEALLVPTPVNSTPVPPTPVNPQSKVGLRPLSKGKVGAIPLSLGEVALGEVALGGVASARGETGKGLGERRQTLLAEQLAVAPRSGLGRKAQRKRPRKPHDSRREQSRTNQQTPVVAGLDLAIHTGELVALIGANGTGKTTLLRALAGLDAPVAGTLTGPRGGMVFQNPEHQFMGNTVRGEVSHNVAAEHHHRVDELLVRFGLDGHAEQSPFSLSGGQKRRLSLASMLAHDHAFLCADEPTFGLDRHGASAVLTALREHSRAGHGVVFSCHDMRAVATYADRVVVLHQGRLLADCTPWELFRDPALVDKAGLAVPPLIAWVAARTPNNTACQQVLRALDARALNSKLPDATVTHGGTDALAPIRVAQVTR